MKYRNRELTSVFNLRNIEQEREFAQRVARVHMGKYHPKHVRCILSSAYTRTMTIGWMARDEEGRGEMKELTLDRLEFERDEARIFVEFGTDLG